MLWPQANSFSFFAACPAVSLSPDLSARQVGRIKGSDCSLGSYAAAAAATAEVITLLLLAR